MSETLANPAPPSLQDSVNVFSQLNEKLKEIQSTIKNTNDSITPFIGNMIKVSEATPLKSFETLGQRLEDASGMFKKVDETLQPLNTSVNTAADSLLDFDGKYGILDDSQKQFVENLKAGANNVGPLLTQISDISQTASEMVKDFAPIAGAIKGTFKDICTGVSNLGITSTFKSIFQDAKESVKGVMDDLSASVKGSFSKIASSIEENGGIKGAMKKAFESSKETIKGVMEDISSSVKGSLGNMSSFIEESGGIKGAMKRTFENAKEAAKSSMEDISSSIKNSINNATSYIKESGGIGGAIKSGFGSMKEKLTSKKDGSSKSKDKGEGDGGGNVFEGLSKNLGKAQTGIENTSKALQPFTEKMSGSINVVKDLGAKFGLLTPAQQKFLEKTSNVVNGIAPALGVFGNFVGVAKNLSGVFGIASNAIKGAGGVIGAITSPIGIAVIAIAGIAAAGYLIYKNWDTIKKVTMEVWNSIKEFMTKLISGLVTSVTHTFDKMKAGIEQVWSGIKEAAKSAWEFIKTIIMAPVLIIHDLVTGNFGKLKEDVHNIFTKLSDSIRGIWDGIYNIFSGIIKTIKAYVEGTFGNIVGSIGSILGKITGVVKEGFNGAIEFIKELPSKALEWGGDFIDGIVNGIKNAIHKVTDAVKGVADTIKSFLHFSVPDEGPLMLAA